MREFDFINKYLRPIAGGNSHNLGDDCAFFNGYCITKDVLVADVHFFKNDAPFNLARKSLRVNLSDLASSGAKPFGFMLGLALPNGTDESWLAEFAKGLASDIKEYNFQLLGGDTVYHDGALTISVTAIGVAQQPVTRKGAMPGDNIFVSGAVGNGFLGLRDKKNGIASGRYVKKYELPEPRLELGLKLPEIATAAIDISDGLLADLGHICKESNVGAHIYSDLIPLADKSAGLMELITGGDDYELLFTSRLEKVEACHNIGKITAHAGLRLDDAEVEAKGYEHGKR